MIEIFVLIKLCQALGATARSKNRSGAWGALGAVLWVGGEVVLAVLGALGGADGLGLYGLALCGALLGASAAFVIVKMLPPIPSANGLPRARVL
jgi:hypothetical protein